MGKNYQVKGHIISSQIDKTSFGGQFNLKWKIKLSNFHVILINYIVTCNHQLYSLYATKSSIWNQAPSSSTCGVFEWYAMYLYKLGTFDFFSSSRVSKKKNDWSILYVPLNYAYATDACWQLITCAPNIWSLRYDSCLPDLSLSKGTHSLITDLGMHASASE